MKDEDVPLVRVANWARFQHYRHRRPPWIKLHRSLLDDFEFIGLPITAQALAPRIWLLASEAEDASIELEPFRLAFRLHSDTQTVIDALKALVDSDFLEANAYAKDILLASCTKPLAPRLHDAAPEKSRDRVEGEKRTDQSSMQARLREATPTANPLVAGRRRELESEYLNLVGRVAELTGKDPIEVSATAAGYEGALRIKTNPADMSDNRLAASLVDLRRDVAEAERGKTPPGGAARVLGQMARSGDGS